jgi:glycosyltransferase involved in cell wall biosynthesis
LGRIAPEKGHLDFLRAAGAMPDRTTVRFSITGAPLFSDATYEQAVRSAGTAAGVDFRGWTDNVSQVLHDLDILVVPSAGHDASPRVILEALSAGTCVLAYPSGGIPELIRDGYSGLLTTSPSAENLTNALRLLAANPELRSRLASNGRRDWETRFRVERFRSEVCAEISQVIISREPAANARHSSSLAPESAHDGRPSAP